ncbi:Oxalate-binding protein [Sporomusa silvacetica DSM 10669]|uniref:Oxalate-binding protein n=1 Tax=Sporomusa silvacetica DSM 10669 TaxID=1123289 RepID=A0ABZ3IUP9_9FIRM|nr:cupin domain-containing protein [Sporomusa silvacetica]OZC19533.1 cupin domain protein [Sporomusa silvacetica DSM 10669]
MVINAEEFKVERRDGEKAGTIHHLLSARQMHDKGRLFARITLDAGAKVALHKHHMDFEVFYILAGTGLVVDNNIEKQVNAGDVIFTDDGESHSIENIGGNILEYLAMVLYV